MPLQKGGREGRTCDDAVYVGGGGHSHRPKRVGPPAAGSSRAGPGAVVTVPSWRERGREWYETIGAGITGVFSLSFFSSHQFESPEKARIPSRRMHLFSFLFLCRSRRRRERRARGKPSMDVPEDALNAETTTTKPEKKGHTAGTAQLYVGAMHAASGAPVMKKRTCSRGLGGAKGRREDVEKQNRDCRSVCTVDAGANGSGRVPGRETGVTEDSPRLSCVEVGLCGM